MDAKKGVLAINAFLVVPTVVVALVLGEVFCWVCKWWISPRKSEQFLYVDRTMKKAQGRGTHHRCVKCNVRQWMQAQQFRTLQPARRVVKTRVCGISGARGLGGCFRISPLKPVASCDLQRLRRDCAQIRSRQKTTMSGHNQDSRRSTG